MKTHLSAAPPHPPQPATPKLTDDPDVSRPYAPVQRIAQQGPLLHSAVVPPVHAGSSASDGIIDLFLDHLRSTPIHPAILLDAMQRCSATAKERLTREFQLYGRLFTPGREAHPYRSSAAYRPAAIMCPAKETRLIWTGIGRLEELVHQLIQRKLTNSKTALFDLFDPYHQRERIIKWDFSRKDHLALLLHELYSKGYVQVVNSKGYFAFAEEHVVGFQSERLRPCALKRRCHVLRSEPEKHARTVAEVNSIIKALGT